MKNGSIAMDYVSSEEKMADAFTKSMTKRKSLTLVKNISEVALKQTLTLFSIGGGPLWPPYSFSLISPERLELRPSNFLTFSFYVLAIRKI